MAERMQPGADMFGSRLVHLDLKGAPLSIPYMEKIFPMLKKWGCTGLLLEYEDTFPYDEDLVVLAASHAYSKNDIEQILQLSAKNGLNVIPLVQSFGHLEFVLKHSRFSSLREVQKYPMALCPSNPGSCQLVSRMLDQVLKLHPSITHFHIGCDEVFHLGVCSNCKDRMEKESIGKEKLFFTHVKKIAAYLRDRYPHLTIIIWDDMLRHAELPTLQDCGLGGLVEPMVWHYQPTFQLPANLWDNLSAVFPNVWVASAFKGATGPCAMVTNLHYHLDNHHAWLATLQSVGHKFKSVRGIALTGWQRYDHFAVLCELFPHALPSLAACLKFVQQGRLVSEDINEVAKDLNFSTALPLDPQTCMLLPCCEFPGSDVYTLAIELFHHQRACKEFFNLDEISGWVNEYNVRSGFINPVHVEPLQARALSLLESCRLVSQRAKPAFSGVFVPGVLEEWQGCFLEPLIAKLEQFVAMARVFVVEGLT